MGYSGKATIEDFGLVSFWLGGVYSWRTWRHIVTENPLPSLTLVRHQHGFTCSRVCGNKIPQGTALCSLCVCHPPLKPPEWSTNLRAAESLCRSVLRNVIHLIYLSGYTLQSHLVESMSRTWTSLAFPSQQGEWKKCSAVCELPAHPRWGCAL